MLRRLLYIALVPIVLSATGCDVLSSTASSPSPVPEVLQHDALGRRCEGTTAVFTTTDGVEVARRKDYPHCVREQEER